MSRSTGMRLPRLAPLLLFFACATASAPRIRFVTDEADAVLHILDKRARGETIAEADWSRLFATEGYTRLKERELAMGRKFEETTFRDFVTSDALLQRLPELHRTLNEWSRIDPARAARNAAAYLPPGSTIAATTYPVIKPATNSFVHDLGRHPALFVYLEPLPRETFEAIVTHEFHHIGYASACPPPGTPEGEGSRAQLRQWLSGFGEGVATVAAAGGPNSRPRLRPDALAEWDRQTQRLDANFAAAEQFLTRVLRGELDEDAERREGMALFGLVGPWYTVGWHMAAVIEGELGRPAVINALCDQRTLLRTYNTAAARRSGRTGESLPMWPEELARAFE
ncbi:MAG TPA: DUF5700 domain-containing putative Zn-dependent protease [Thermoanaerobaculia bacterium]|nr:DUF5700 domain-containing putative Zn-dependent protease [Thermoanaerobaculia bacterium]